MSARRKKARASRVKLTHIEVRRGDSLRLRLAIADDAMAEAGDAMGVLIQKIAPGAVSTRVIAATREETPAIDSSAIAFESSEPPSDFAVSPQHEVTDDAYHAGLRARLVELISSLCDASLADALEIAREESARRADGVN